MNLFELATLVRDEAERWAREVGYESETLLMQCAVCSVAFVAAARHVGIDAELVCGWFLADDEPPVGHFCAFAWESDTCHLVDLTLTQYQPDAPRAAVLTIPDATLKRYAFLSYGSHARESVREHDEADIAALTARVLARLAAHQPRSAAVEASAP